MRPDDTGVVEGDGVGVVVVVEGVGVVVVEGVGVVFGAVGIVGVVGEGGGDGVEGDSDAKGDVFGKVALAVVVVLLDLDVP